jgi:hypothetical protein
VVNPLGWRSRRQGRCVTCTPTRGASTEVDVIQHGLDSPVARTGMRRRCGMAIRGWSIEVRVTTANAKVQGTLDFKSSR